MDLSNLGDVRQIETCIDQKCEIETLVGKHNSHRGMEKKNGQETLCLPCCQVLVDVYLNVWITHGVSWDQTNGEIFAPLAEAND